MRVDQSIKPADLDASMTRLFELAIEKVRDIDATWDPDKGTPVFTVEGRYTTRGWTEWTQGFQYGCAILAFDATDDGAMLELGRRRTLEQMAPHVTHIGVHDHGFNNLSTYGNLRRLMLEGRTDHDPWQQAFYEMAIKASGAVQAARWSTTADTDPMLGGGYVYSFNGPHSLFVDTIRSMRILCVAHQLGHVLMGENDQPHNLLGRAVKHALTTARYIVFPGDSGHTYDVRGRTAHEAVFNRNDGRFRCRSTQQGYSPFSTWTRGLAWAVLGFAEQLEFLTTCTDAQVQEAANAPRREVIEQFTRTAKAVCDHYIDDVTAADGVPYWDDGGPNLHKLGDWRAAPADPYNDHEPVDSSAAAIAAQGLIRLGQLLGDDDPDAARYLQAGLTVARTIMAPPYLSEASTHQGLLLHSIYHWPNHWDHVPAGRTIASGESSMWGDYHLLELANLIKRMAEDGPYPRFF